MEPHRELVETSLALRSQVGGHYPAGWRELWWAAVRRQADLADQSEDEAHDAVRDIVGQLGRLSEEAAWFREDDGLRQRAITETLLYGTGLTERVPSRAAQELWRAAGRPPAGPAEIEDAVAARNRWIDEWHAWALRD
ncbi:hypothetical protein [Actinoplanes sp. NPDC051851]|uniref:hypothetical protein n=1 Tax=Actinoplanes sp. NPDC051851 TaxID=3154753 RepID=UPI0034380CFE